MNQCEELLKLLMEAVQQEGQKKEEPCANGAVCLQGNGYGLRP